MNQYVYMVVVECDTAAEAAQVMAERLGPEEDYGFTYTVDYRPVSPNLLPGEPHTDGDN